MRSRLRIFLIASLACWLKFGATPAVMGFAADQLCDELCTESSDCTEMCYPDLVALENGTPYISCLDWGVYDPSIGCCGDGVCDIGDGEEMCNCSADCGPCIAGEACNPMTQTGCGPNEICNALGVCKGVPDCADGKCDNGSKTAPPNCQDGGCGSDGDCCSGNKCVGYWNNLDPQHPDQPEWLFSGFCVPYTNNPPLRPSPQPTASRH